MARRPAQFPVGGGLNITDPIPTLPDGALTFSKNVECVPGNPRSSGYRRCAGYERFDGRPGKPSLATYTRLSFGSGGPRAYQIGDTVTGSTSGATGKVIWVSTLTSGSWLAGDAVGEIRVTATTGTFVNGEALLVGGVDYGTMSAAPAARALDDHDFKATLRSAQAYYRALIQKPPGQGAVRGVAIFKGDVYAFRDAVGGASGKMYKATASGWSEVALGAEVSFTAGNASVGAGDTLTQGAVTATILKVIINSGDEDAGTAVGRLIISAPSGGNFAAGAATSTGGGALTLSGAQTANALPAGGRYEFRVHNFSGSSLREALYGVNGVGKGFEYDGSAFTFINTGMAVDTPTHLAILDGVLWYSFPTGSLQNSSIGDPTTPWTLRFGAGETGIGDEITALLETRSETLAVYGEDSISVLYKDPALKNFSKSLGAQAYSVQEVGAVPLAIDAKGAHTLAASQAFGDFESAMLSEKIRSLIEARPKGVRASVVINGKGQYRVAFDDKTALMATFSGAKLVGWTQAVYEHQFNCFAQGDDGSGLEVIYGGTDDGYVMQLESGTSFDGAAIESIMRFPFITMRAPERKKRWYKLTLELYSDRPITIMVSSEFDYGASPGESNDAAVPPTGGFWDRAVWEEFYWDSAVVAVPEVPISGVGKNMGLLLRHEDDIDPSFVIQAMAVQFEYWGIAR